MKSEAIPRTGIVDAISTGLSEAARRPWLWLLPIVVDLGLWLAPQLSLARLTEQLMTAWKALLPLVYTPEQMRSAQEGIDLLYQGMIELSKGVNLGGMVTSGWLTPPSALMPAQATRYLMISDAVLAPVSLGAPIRPLGPSAWQGAPLEMGSVFGVIAIAAGLWVVAHLVTALYFRQVAVSIRNDSAGAAPANGSLPVSRQAPGPAESIFRGWLPLAARFAVVSLFASLGAFMLRLPLLLVTTLAVFSGSAAAQLLFVVGGGITLWLTMWFLSSVYFVGDALAFDRQPLWQGLMQSLVLVRSNSLRVLILATLVNVLLLGARAIWGFIGENPAGAILAIVVNAYLVTGMTIGIYVYYRDLRRHAHLAEMGRQLSK
ncbi:MAG: hypothetical protein MUC34_07085 [Anaerolineae bacterium]|jgi:hypothetical protein|nr:hypothetical protein [Anaerolineae bacterium]